MTNKEFVRLKCSACLNPIAAFAVDPKSIPVIWCERCQDSYETAEKEYEHPND